MSNSKDKTTEELIAEIKELKQNLLISDSALENQLIHSRQLEAKLGQLSVRETQLQNIFNQFTEGFPLCELIFAKQGNPADYSFIANDFYGGSLFYERNKLAESTSSLIQIS